MKIVIAGSGAMGCRFGSMLYEAGNDVLLVDNWDLHVQTIKKMDSKLSKMENDTFWISLFLYLMKVSVALT